MPALEHLVAAARRRRQSEPEAAVSVGPESG